MVDAKADIELLLECLKCQIDNPTALRQTLLTLTSLCSSAQGEAQNHLRRCGGLKYLVTLLTTTVCSDVKQAALYALGCAIEKNTHSQMALCNSSIFSFLCDTLSTRSSCLTLDSSAKTCHIAVFLIISLVADNGKGQYFARTSGCLQNLLDIFREILQDVGESDIGHNQELFAATTSALCVCVNNPQNDENQHAVASVFPLAFKHLQKSLPPTVVKSVVSFLGLAVANNVHNQQRVVTCGGLEALVGALHRVVNRCNEEEENIHAALAVVSTLDTVISDNVSVAVTCGNLGILPLLLKLLDLPCMNPPSLAKITLTLGHCIENCKENQMTLVQHGGIGILVQQLGKADSEEYVALVKFVLQQCVQAKEASSDKAQTTGSSNNTVLLDSITQQLLQNNKIHEKLNELEAKLNQPPPLLAPISAHSSPTPAPCPVPASSSPEESSPMFFVREKPKKLQSVKRRNACRELFQQKKSNPVVESSSEFEDTRDNRKNEKKIQNQPSSNMELDKIKKQLQKERSLRQKLEKEIKTTKEVLRQREEEEQATANKAQLLAEELERQHREQADTDELRKQLQEYKQRHEELLQLKESKQNEIDDLEQQLSTLQGNLMASSHLLSPGSLYSISTHITKNRQFQQSTPASIVRMKTACQAKPSTPDVVPEISPTVLASAQKTKQNIGTKTHIRLTKSKTDENKIDEEPVTKTQIDKTDNINATKMDKTDNINATKMDKTDNINATKMDKTDNINATKMDKACGTDTMENHDLPKLDTPFVATSHTTDGGFVKPQAPMKRRNPSSVHCSTPLTTSSKTRKRQLFTSGVGNVNRDEEKAASVPDWSDAISGIHCISSSPARTVCSEFDAGLLKQAASGGQYWTRKRITNYVTSCPPTAVTKSPLSVRRISGPKVFKKNCVVKARPISDHRGQLSRITSVEEDDGSNAVVIEVQIPNSDAEKEHDKEKRNSLSNTECPGCQPPAALQKGELLNSRTFNIVLETCHGTCAYHRKKRIEERNYVKQNKHILVSPIREKRILKQSAQLTQSNSNRGMSVYDFNSAEDVRPKLRKLTPQGHSPIVPVNPRRKPVSPAPTTTSTVQSQRRRRVPYTEQEEMNIVDGVEKMGRFWRQILHTYHFHPSRTAVDLKDKYKSMMKKQGKAAAAVSKPASSEPPEHLAFSMAEDRRLRRGVRQYGYSWTAILKGFTFAPSRTAEELRQRWRSLHKLVPPV